MKPLIVLDGSQVRDLPSFAALFSQVVLQGKYDWQGNLDALNDILRGGFGTPESGFVLRWINATSSRASLGHAATIEWLKRQITTCHPSNVVHLEERLAAASNGVGPTLFDAIVEIINDHGPAGAESEDGVVLELVD